MRHLATCFTSTPVYQVTDAIFTGNRVSIDWDGDDKTNHLEADSTDGHTFRGHYGNNDLDDNRHVEFTLFKSAAGELLFVGRWWNTETGGGDGWLFRLVPQKSISSTDVAT
jgi:hypothetical protein